MNRRTRSRLILGFAFLEVLALGAMPPVFAAERFQPEGKVHPGKRTVAVASPESTPASNDLYHNDRTPGVQFSVLPTPTTSIHGDFIHLQDYGAGLDVRQINPVHATQQDIPGVCSDSNVACVTRDCPGETRRCTRTGEVCTTNASCPVGDPSNGQYCASCLFAQDWVDRLSVYDNYDVASSPVYSGLLVQKTVNMGGVWAAGDNVSWLYRFEPGEFITTDPDIFYTIESKLVDFGDPFDGEAYNTLASWNFHGGGPPERGFSDTGSYIDRDSNGILDAADLVTGYSVAGCPGGTCQANLRMIMKGPHNPALVDPGAEFYTIAGNGDSYVDLAVGASFFDTDDSGSVGCTGGLGPSVPFNQHVILEGGEIASDSTSIAAISAIFERAAGYFMPGTGSFSVSSFSARVRHGDPLVITRNDGVNPPTTEAWDLSVCRSSGVSSGTSSASRNACPDQGGPITMTLELLPKLTLVKRTNHNCVRTIDASVPVSMVSEPFRWNDAPSDAIITVGAGISFDKSCDGSVDTPGVSGSSTVPWFPGTFIPRCDASCDAAAPVTRLFRLTGPGWGLALHEAVATLSPAAATDTDDDGVLDGADDCDLVADSAQLDTDGDGVGDACDNAVDCNPDQNDADGDGRGDVSDCAPTDDTAFAIPGVVSNFRFTTPTLLEWDSVAPSAGTGTKYDALRGLRSALPVGPGGALSPDETCFDGLTMPRLEDNSTPPAMEAYFYVVLAKNACGNGGYGDEGHVGAPPGPRVSTTCP